MTNGIGRISGGGDYGFGPLMPGKSDVKEEQVAEKIIQPETIDVAPDDVMRMLESQNIFVPTKSEFVPVELSQDTKDRVAESMAKFEAVFAAALNEFDDQDIAFDIANLMIDANF